MVQTPSLLQKAKERAPAFEKPDVAALIPEGQEDAVGRVVAAGLKIAYHPSMRQQLLESVQGDEPVPVKLGDNVAGLMLMMQKRAKGGGIPPAVMLPAAMELLGEAAEMLSAAGETVTREDFNDGAIRMIGQIAKAMDPNATPETIQQGLAAGANLPDEGGETEEPGEAEEPDEEGMAMAQGMSQEDA